MCANWNSYSKSASARRPRMITVAPRAPAVVDEQALERRRPPAAASLPSASRDHARAAPRARTAAPCARSRRARRSRGRRAAATRRRMSTWPFVIGSKVPGIDGDRRHGPGSRARAGRTTARCRRTAAGRSGTGSRPTSGGRWRLSCSTTTTAQVASRSLPAQLASDALRLAGRRADPGTPRRTRSSSRRAASRRSAARTSAPITSRGRRPGLAQVAAQRRQRAPVALDEDGRGGAPRDSASIPSAPVPAYRSSTGPAGRTQDVEDRLTNLGGRRPRPRAAGRDQSPASIQPAGQSH